VEKKILCCVTTRCRILCVLTILGHGLGSLAARALSLGVAGFDVGVLTTFGLPSCRLPAFDLTQAFRVLAVPLVPTPWLVLASASFAQADPRARSARSGGRARP
jgi:hypothetical protein